MEVGIQRLWAWEGDARGEDAVGSGGVAEEPGEKLGCHLSHCPNVFRAVPSLTGGVWEGYDRLILFCGIVT